MEEDKDSQLFPNEIWAMIFEYLTFFELLTLQSVSHLYHSLASNSFSQKIKSPALQISNTEFMKRLTLFCHNKKISQQEKISGLKTLWKRLCSKKTSRAFNKNIEQLSNDVIMINSLSLNKQLTHKKRNLPLIYQLNIELKFIKTKYPNFVQNIQEEDKSSTEANRLS